MAKKQLVLHFEYLDMHAYLYKYRIYILMRWEEIELNNGNRLLAANTILSQWHLNTYICVLSVTYNC